MKRLLALAASAAVALVSGCSASGVPLKASCDALAPVVAEFGKVAPSRERYAEYLPKVQAVADAGDAATKEALAPYVAALTKGAAGDTVAVTALASSMLTLMPKCAAAGSTALTPATASAAPSPSSSSSTPEASDMDAELGNALGPEDFKVAIKVRKKECFGSAGCNITFRINPSYVGSLYLPKSGTIEVTYEVKGGDDPLINTFTIDGDGTAHFEAEETISTPSSKSKLKAVVTDVEWSED